MTPQARFRLSYLLCRSAEATIIILATGLAIVWTIDLANRFFAGF